MDMTPLSNKSNHYAEESKAIPNFHNIFYVDTNVSVPIKVYVTGPAKINHMSTNYTKLYFC